jgi:hypothetical protein
LEAGGASSPPVPAQRWLATTMRHARQSWRKQYLCRYATCGTLLPARVPWRPQPSSWATPSRRSRSDHTGLSSHWLEIRLQAVVFQLWPARAGLFAQAGTRSREVHAEAAQPTFSIPGTVQDWCRFPRPMFRHDLRLLVPAYYPKWWRIGAVCGQFASAFQAKPAYRPSGAKSWRDEL